VQDRSVRTESTQQSSSPSRSVGNKLDISDTNRWQLANELMKHFDGIITEISGNMYE
jgi:hypothetical protein